jgi:hypothetical protein
MSPTSIKVNMKPVLGLLAATRWATDAAPVRRSALPVAPSQVILPGPGQGGARRQPNVFYTCPTSTEQGYHYVTGCNNAGRGVGSANGGACQIGDYVYCYKVSCNDRPDDELIRNRHGICLDASERDRNGGHVHMWACDALNANQQWSYNRQTGQIKNRHGYCLDASNRNDNGGTVHMWQCLGGEPNQQWDYDSVSGQIKNRHGICLNTSGRNSNGGHVHMMQCDSFNANQQWSLRNVDNAATYFSATCASEFPVTVFGADSNSVWTTSGLEPYYKYSNAMYAAHLRQSGSSDSFVNEQFYSAMVSGQNPGHSCSLDEDCFSMRCVQGTCSGGNTNDRCEMDFDCKNTLCVQGYCQDGSNYSSCERDTECASGICSRNKCESGQLGATCEPYTGGQDCGPGLVCEEQPHPLGFAGIFHYRCALPAKDDQDCQSSNPGSRPRQSTCSCHADCHSGLTCKRSRTGGAIYEHGIDTMTSEGVAGAVLHGLEDASSGLWFTIFGDSNHYCLP